MEKTNDIAGLTEAQKAAPGVVSLAPAEGGRGQRRRKKKKPPDSKGSIRLKVMLVIFALGAAMGLMVLIGSYVVYKDSMEEHYKHMAENVNQSTISALDDEAVAELVDVLDNYVAENGRSFSGERIEDEAVLAVNEDEDFQACLKLLRQLCEDNEAEYLYMVYPIEDGQFFIFDSDTVSDAPFGYYMKMVDEYAKNYKEEFENGEELPQLITHTQYGWLVSVATRYVYNGRFLGYMCVDISMDEVVNDRIWFVIRSLAAIVILTLLAGVAIYFLFDKTLVHPIRSMTEAATDYITSKDAQSSGESTEESSISKLDIHTHDELESLSDALKEMEKDINEYIDNLTTVTKEKERIGAELNVATQIQADMLPSIFPPYPDRIEFDIFASMDPAKEVGGDFYDFFLVDDDHIALVMADVSGKGVPAALFMVIAKTLIKNSAQGGDLSPIGILGEANNQLCEGNEASLFVTVWLGIVTISTGDMVVANAGHEYPAIYRKSTGSFELMKGKHSMPVAVMEDAPFKEEHIKLEPGDRLFIYTDGVPEATSAANELYGTDRMMDALNAADYKTAEDVLVAVRADVDKFVAEAPQFDDLTMLCFDYFGKQ